MSENAFSLRVADWDADREALCAIRIRVFVREQGVPLEMELDQGDALALHLLAEDATGRPVGTARMLPDGHIGRMAVLPEWRRRGVGSALLRELLQRAAETAGVHPYLDAQSSAVGFYRRHGFAPEGAEFSAAGIPHRRMRPRGRG
jgi:predicted GNAT family N-acyltransferase